MSSEPEVRVYKSSYPGLYVHETVKTENGKILFHMDAHGPPISKKKYFFLVTSQNFFTARVIAFCLALSFTHKPAC